MTPGQRVYPRPMNTLILLAPVLLACGGDGSQPLPTPLPGGSANYSASLDDGPDFSRPHSLAAADWWLAYDSGGLFASFSDSPPVDFQTELEREGSCRLVGFESSFCDAGCEWGEQCVDGECVGEAPREDRGALLWSWPEGSEELQPDDLLGYWGSAQASTVGASEVTVSAITLEAPTLLPVTPDGSWEDALSARAAGEDLTLRWTDPLEDSRVRLHMTDCVGSHGGIGAAEIECEGPDSGALVIPGAYLDALADGDWSRGECGSHALVRYAAAADPQDTGLRYESRASASFFWRPGW